MDTRKAIAYRKCTRDFINDKQITDDVLERILEAANAAPVAHGEYDALHLTVIQNAEILNDIKEVALDCLRDPILDIYYGAPTCILISTKHGSVPELDMANVGTIAENMLLQATDDGIQSCYIWGTVLALREDPELAVKIELPEGYVPLGSIVLGYSKEQDTTEKQIYKERIKVNVIK